MFKRSTRMKTTWFCCCCCIIIIVVVLYTVCYTEGFEEEKEKPTQTQSLFGAVLEAANKNVNETA